MNILIEDKIIDTLQIADIYDIEANKKMFLNTEAGFVILMMDGSNHKLSEIIPYESRPSEIYEIKNRWKKLQDDITEKWNSDRVPIPTFKIQR